MKKSQCLAAAAIIAAVAFVGVDTVALAAPMTTAQNIAAGKSIAFNRTQGNCLACHVLPGGTMAGNVGPDLSVLPLKAIFKTKEKLVDFLYDPEKMIPHINMPPFGKNKVLTHHQMELVADYLWSLKG
ncbi:sulfur oxidation c-type cytochrome SoxX [Acidithiobacillus sp. M4-SHS-6]|uniref:sulfur oxidation c-type cytochrome SoxX n=1 Tax=Acidithiobacillus sp. M4-SHS-6 TaxID=3383024 RepID=UPI0039BEC31A